MADRDYEFHFVIEGFTPDTMPMHRLAEYLQDVATILGEHSHVHLLRTESGSHRVVMAVESHAVPKVNERLRRIQIGEGDRKALDADRRINVRLAEDNTSGKLVPPHANIYPFPGVQKYSQQRVGPISDPDTIAGIPIKIGGQKDIVPVHIQEPDGNIVVCRARRELAHDIAQFIFTQQLRVHGTGKWVRDGHGEWSREDLLIHSFEPAPHIDLQEDIERMKPAFREFGELENPLSDLEELRHGQGRG